MRLSVTAIGISGPGLPDWPGSAAVLAGAAPYTPVAYHSSGRSPLAGAERRRATAVTRLALEAAMEAAGPDPAQWNMPTIFASSCGEADVCDAIFEQLSRPERIVSPIQFHNSVHNTASGYWGIATGSHQMATSLACFDETFAAGLLEASALIAVDRCAALLVAFDAPPPYPIGPHRPLIAPFAVALRLGPDCASGALAHLGIAFDDGPARESTRMPSEALEALRLGNPAARALPLLAAIAGGGANTVYLDCAGPSLLRLEVAP